jgi:beta-lactamase class A
MMNLLTRSTFLSLVSLLISSLACSGFRADSSGTQTKSANTQANSQVATAPSNVDVSARLVEQLQPVVARAQGDVAVAVTHVESGRTVEINGAKQLRLYSVWKLPLAVAVLKAVEDNRLKLDQMVHFDEEDLSPGSRFNSEMWSKPVDKSIQELLELSIVRSDNTSSDMLLKLVGGPAVVTELMRSLGLKNIEIVSSIREFLSGKGKPNTGSATDLAELLAELQKGKVLRASEFSVLRGLMERAITGLKRLRGDLPEATVVADKTGTGDSGSVTNDVGLITLPNGKGHLAMAVLVSGSSLPPEGQEKVIAELARIAHDTPW